MLDTVIKIGQLYRQAPDAHRYHEQINYALKDVEATNKNKDKDGNTIETVFLNIPVIDNGDSFMFDIDRVSEITDEDKQKQLYYLNFKTSKKDAEKRYLFGDIVYCHFIDKKGNLNEFGNYRLFGKWEKRTSFVGAEEVSTQIENKIIQSFRIAFRTQKIEIENILKSKPSVVIHFDFNNKHWFNINGLIADIDKVITTNLVEKHKETDNVVLTKYLYKTLGGTTPGFSDTNAYKNKLFSLDDIISVMYATQVYQDPIIRINNIGIIALPHSDKLTTEDIVQFFNKDSNSFRTERSKEETLIFETSDEMFTTFTENKFSDTVKFDIIFTSIPKSPAGVFCDLIELSNIEKSLLVRVHDEIRKQRNIIIERINNEFPNQKKPFYFSVRNSFLKILGDVTTDKKKYQAHLLKVLPQLYSDTYYQDPLILPAFLEKVEYNIRESGQAFSTLKYDFYFLMNIQKNNNLMKITQTKSYAIGKNLGIMARQFAAWRSDCPIKSFEKSYVGNLSRRITTIEELVKFAGFINEKLTIHARLYPDVKEAYLQLVETIDMFEGEKYNKYNCALGFFESYYGKKETTKEEN
jgi:hypothetical protein